METIQIKQTITQNQEQKVEFEVPDEGLYSIELTASSPTSWNEKENEAVMARLYINDTHHQDIVLFYGDRLFTYQRLLGELCEGNYTLSIEFFNPLAQASSAWIEKVNIKKLELQGHDLLAAKFSPKLYGRSVYSNYDNLYTDTPLEMIYFIEDWEHGKVIEYQMVFSHEDEGTPAKLLMAKWGRLLDIEYMARVYLTDDLNVDHVDYQGPHHKIMSYSKPMLEGKRPVLQTATCNGNFTDRITSEYYFFFLPSYEWKKDEEPREIVMEKFPYVNAMMQWEAERQLTTGLSDINIIKDLKQYLFIQSSVWEVNLGQPTIDIACKLSGENRWHSSSFGKKQIGHFSPGYTGPYNHFGIAVLLPENKSHTDIEEIKVCLINEEISSVVVKDLKVLFMNERSEIELKCQVNFTAELTRNQSEKTVWNK
ncbi:MULTISPECIES: hypothetical protein [Bacillus]|uniref:Uncharacterized protein n=2 Tax=Bacillus TaxID=1386 RepID=A0A0M4FUD9_9BACI|nr:MULTISPECIES: hypothetical protein [Bacillus]ALC83484.1 hypothetical protein AM592_19520 [Bacillus gobiensis]MBP1082443.1 hypothetical protein [Bacillus capparidis]MED1097309.1 hypothetical protein [Bacillus capparidis]